MNKPQNFAARWLVAVLVFALGTAAPAARAATASSTATIDWSKLTFTTSGPLFVFPITGVDWVLNGAAWLDANLTLLDSEVSTTGSASVTGSGATTATADGTLAGGPSASAVSDSGLTLALSRVATNYGVLGNGTLTISVHYAMSTSTSGTPTDAFALIRMRGLYFSSIEADPINVFSESTLLESDESGPLFSNGTLSIGIGIPADGPGSFLAIRGVALAAAAVVPVPAALPLFASAFIPFVAIRRRVH